MMSAPRRLALHSGFNLRQWTLAHVACLLATWAAGPVVHGQSTVRYGGRPFVQIAQANSADPVAGFISGFGRAQVVGGSVALATLNGVSAGGVFRGRGGPLEVITATGTSIGGDVLQTFHDGFARGTGLGGELVIAAGGARADGLYRTDGTVGTRLLTPGTVLPNSGGLAANALGEPYLVGDALAVIAWHDLGGGSGVDFRGVYRVVSGRLEPVADTATALPGGFGVPDTFSSQVGFDGDVLAFWASRGPFSETEGMFVQGGDGTLVKIAQDGDSFPGGGIIDGFLSPPVVENGVVYFFAYDSPSHTRLVRYESGVMSVLVQDGDPTPEGGQIQNLGQFGLGVVGRRAYFPALSAGGAGVYTWEDGVMGSVVPAGAVVGGMRPQAMVLQDVDADTLVLDVVSPSLRRLVANLASPAVPVIVSDLQPMTVAGGSRLELKVTALGDGPLSYAWFRGTTPLPDAGGDTLVIESVKALDVGYYRVRVSNAVGTTQSTEVLINVEVPPVISVPPGAVTVEVGDALNLRVDAIGGLPLGYYWHKDGVAAVNDSPVFGFFARRVATLEDAGHYTVTVSNAFGVVTSAPAAVTVTPAAPNPVIAGARVVKVVDETTRVSGTDVAVSVDELSEMSARWMGPRMVFTGQAVGGAPLGVLEWRDGSWFEVLAAGVELGNGLGISDGYNLVAAAADEPLAVRATQARDGFPQPVGIYRADGAGLTRLADLATHVPGGGGELFSNFYGDAIYANGRVLFILTGTGAAGVFAADAAGVERVLVADQDLPVVGTSARQFQGLAYDGTNWVVVAATAGLAEMVALHGDGEGTVQGLMAKGDPVPGTTSTVRTFGPAAVMAGEVYLTVFDAGFARHVLRWAGGEFERIAGPGIAVRDVGTLQSIESSTLEVSGGRAYLAARITTAAGVQQGIVAAGPEGVVPVLVGGKVDGRRLSAVYVVDADGDRLILLAHFVDGGRALLANVGESEVERLELVFERAGSSALRMEVPQGAVLESSDSVAGPWRVAEEMVAGEVQASGAMRFFRLRKP